MPKTSPWEAPEWHERGFTIAAAKKADFYSFGLLCIWILFGNQFVDIPHAFSESTQGKVTSSFLSNPTLKLKDREQFETLKMQGTIPSLAAKLIHVMCITNTNESEALTKFFDAVLCLNPSERSLHIDALGNIENLQRATTSSLTSSKDSISALINEDFSFAQSTRQLCRTDYLVRANAVKSLEARVSYTSCPRCEPECCEKAAFQLAFAYRTGFGVARNYDEAQRHLKHSKKDEVALQAEIERARIGPAVLQRKGLFDQLWNQGHIRTMSFIQAHLGRNSVKEVVLHLTKELEDVEQSFGEENYVSLNLRETLSSVLREGGLWTEAEEVEARLLQMRQQALGLDNDETQRSLSNMASIYRLLGRWEEAETTGRQVLEYMMTACGPEHTDTLTSTANLAAIHLEKGDAAEAVRLYNRILKIEMGIFGIEHMDTLLTMSNLALALGELDEYSQAEKLHSTAAKLSAQIVGINNPVALSMLNNLAVHYSKRGRWDEAQKIAEQVVATRREVLGNRHPSTLTAMQTLAHALKSNSKFKDAEELLVEVMREHVNSLGKRRTGSGQ